MDKPKNYFLKDKIINTILSREDFKDYTSSIISAVLNIPYDEVYKNLKVISPRITKNVNYKNSIVDNVFNLDKNVINIEINYNFDDESVNKNIRYLCHLLLDQVGPGDKDIYKKVQQININNYDYFKKGEFIYKSTIREEKYNIVRSDLYEIYDINMEYLREISYTNIKKMKSSKLERLLYIFVCEDDKIREGVYKGDVLMEKLNDELYKLTDDGVLYYDLDEFHEREAKAIGRKEGFEEGRKETLKEIAIRLYSQGTSESELSNILNISLEEVKKIINE